MPINADQADREIAAFLQEYPALASLRFIHRDRQEDFYGPTATIEAVGIIKGAFLPRRREVHLPLAGFQDLQDFRKSLRHEGIGHFGTLTLADGAKRALLEAIAASKDSTGLRPAWSAAQRIYGDVGELRLAEEVFCMAAEAVGGQPPTHEAFASVWLSTVHGRSRPMTLDDVRVVVNYVADGLRRNARQQLIFPEDDRSQFRAPFSKKLESHMHAVSFLLHGLQLREDP